MIGFIVGIIFAVIGLFMLIVGVVLYFKKKSKISGWIETTGKIVGFENKVQDVGYDMKAEVYSPIVEFQGNDSFVSYANKIYLARRYVYYKVGDTVTVIYNPHDNYEYYIKSDKRSSYQKEYTFISCGSAFLVAGIVCSLILDRISMIDSGIMERVLLLLAPIILGAYIKYGNTPKE